MLRSALWSANRGAGTAGEWLEQGSQPLFIVSVDHIWLWLACPRKCAQTWLCGQNASDLQCGMIQRLLHPAAACVP